jgi:tetratricopeptide (TPR) repeat protein
MALANQSLRLAGLGRYEEALTAVTEATNTYRALAAARPDAFTPNLALALANQSLWLAELGRYEEALAAVTEAVDIRRRLAAARPDVVWPRPGEGAGQPVSLAGGAGSVGGGAGAVTEATDTYRQLAVQHAVLVPGVAGSLVIQGLVRAQLGDFEGAVFAGREAVSIYTALMSADPDRYRDGHEQAIELLADYLKELGRTEREIAEELDRLKSGA